MSLPPEPPGGDYAPTMGFWDDIAPKWLEAGSAFLALVAATAAVKAAFNTNEQQSAQIEQLAKAEAERVQKEKREQADSVAIWFTFEGKNKPRVMYSNRSGLPIYNVCVIINTPWGNTISNLSTLGPTAEPIVASQVLADVVAAGGEGITVTPGEEFYYIKKEILPDGITTWSELISRGYIRLGFAFRDVSETPWFRTPHGQLGETGMLGAAIARLGHEMHVEL